MNYMNSVSEASQALNQVTALRQEAEMQFQQKKEQLGQELELPSELTLTAAGSYLGKKVLGYVGEKFGSTISDVAGQVGISQETVGKALSGDISGALEQGAQEVSTAVSGAVESAVGQAQEMVGGLVEEGTGILGRISGALENIPSLTPSSIMPDIDIGNIYNQGLEDLRAQAGIDENIFRDFTNVSIENSRPFSFNTPQPTEIEMTDFSNIATPATEATTTAEASTAEAVSTAGTAGEAGAVATAETVGEVAGAEAVGAGLDVTGVLAPIGALVGLIGGIVGFFEGHHQEAETMSEAPTPILNPSSQFL